MIGGHNQTQMMNRNFSNERDKSMQDIRENNGNVVGGSLRTSRQKKTIRKSDSPSQSGGGVCFSLFKCCPGGNAGAGRDVESRIEQKQGKRNGKKVQMDANPEVIDVSEANQQRLRDMQSEQSDRQNRFK